jgi:hypothetical protein
MQNYAVFCIILICSLLVINSKDKIKFLSYNCVIDVMALVEQTKKGGRYTKKEQEQRKIT